MRLPIVQTRSAVHAAMPARPHGFAERGWPQLEDAQGRRYDYLRLSITDRCDLACRYCMPAQGESDHAMRRDLLSFEEALRVVEVFVRLGIRRVRFTGGEPLVRKDALKLVEMVGRLPQAPQLVMTSNATRLGELAAPLRRAGLSGVNISLDSLDPDRFRRLTRGGDLSRVLAGVHAAIDAGLEVKLNTVILGGQNDAEFGTIVDYAWGLGITPRFIELMPLGETAAQRSGEYMPVAQVVARLDGRLRDGGEAMDEGKGPARYLAAADGSGRRVGFISALSDEFCDACNRVRINAQGDMRACLASRQAVSLRDLMRAGGDDLDLVWAAHWSLRGKAAGHGFNDTSVDEYENVGMSLIGG